LIHVAAITDQMNLPVAECVASPIQYCGCPQLTTCGHEQFCTVRRELVSSDHSIILSTREVIMHTKDRLAVALREAGLPLMAKMAEAGVYSNGLSLQAMPELVLRRDLEDARSTLASALLWRVDKGEFEATDEELDAGNEQMVTGGMILAIAQKFNMPRA
jgi:hypothetical protein